MNLKAFAEFNRFKELVTSKRSAGWQEEIRVFERIKYTESLPIDANIEFAKRNILIGNVESNPNTRPVVYNHNEGSTYPVPVKLAFFRKLDLFQDIIELQDTIDVVTDPYIKLEMENKVFDSKIMKLSGIYVVYGKALRKGNHLVPHLTLAEATSQLVFARIALDKIMFYVCDSAEECGNLTTHAGYHAYRIAVYEPSLFPTELIPEISIDSYAVE